MRRDEANASIDDSGNVLLLEPASPDLRFSNIPARPAAGDMRARLGLVVVTLYYTKADEPGTFGTLFDRSLRPLAEADGAQTLAAYVTSSQENNYPKLPVRSDEHISSGSAHFRMRTPTRPIRRSWRRIRAGQRGGSPHVRSSLAIRRC
jgi:hypothetical protein